MILFHSCLPVTKLGQGQLVVLSMMELMVLASSPSTEQIPEETDVRSAPGAVRSIT